MIKKSSSLIVLGAIALASFSSPIRAQPTTETATEDVISLSGLTCRDLLKAEGDDRSNLMIFMHGYISGKTGNMSINGPVLAAISQRIIDACIDQPEQKLLSVFET